MPRKGAVPRRHVLPDPVYSNDIVARLINKIMLDGKKGLAARLVYDALDKINERTGNDPLETLETAIKNAMPLLEVRPRRVGGATYQVPSEVRPERRQTLALRWLVTASRNRNERTMADRLAGEILDAAGNTGTTIRRREELHRMAEANRAFAHYRW